MSTAPVNVPPVQLAGSAWRSPRRHAVTQPVEPPGGGRSFSWSPEAREFNEREAVVFETFTLMRDIAVLEDEIQPMRDELRQAMRETRLQARVEDDSGKSLALESRIRALEREYDRLLIEEAMLRSKFSCASEMRLRRTIERQWDEKDDLDFDLEELQERMVRTDAEKHGCGVVRAEEIAKEQRKVTKILRKKLGDLEKEGERLNAEITTRMKERAKERKEDKRNKLEKKLARIRRERIDREMEMRDIEYTHRKKIELLKATKKDQKKSPKAKPNSTDIVTTKDEPEVGGLLQTQTSDFEDRFAKELNEPETDLEPIPQILAEIAK